MTTANLESMSDEEIQRYLSKLREEHDDVKEVVVQLKKDVMKLQKDVEQKYKEQESLKPEFSKAEQLKEALGNAQAVKKKLKESTKQLQNVENTHARERKILEEKLVNVEESSRAEEAALNDEKESLLKTIKELKSRKEELQVRKKNLAEETQKVQSQIAEEQKQIDALPAAES